MRQGRGDHLGTVNAQVTALGTWSSNPRATSEKLSRSLFGGVPAWAEEARPWSFSSVCSHGMDPSTLARPVCRPSVFRGQSFQDEGEDSGFRE